jgi:hypothetical protein
MCYSFQESAPRRLQGRVGIAWVTGLMLYMQVYLECEYAEHCKQGLTNQREKEGESRPRCGHGHVHVQDTNTH